MPSEEEEIERAIVESLQNKCQFCGQNFSTIEDVQAHHLECLPVNGLPLETEATLQISSPKPDDNLSLNKSLVIEATPPHTQQLNERVVTTENYTLNRKLALTKKHTACDRLLSADKE